MDRAIVFIDGNNFYHGMRSIRLLLKDLDLERFSEKLILDRELIEIRFYIGRLKRQGDISLYTEQKKFLDELEKYNLINLYEGRMECHEAKGVVKKLNGWLDNLSKDPNQPELPEQFIKELREIAESERFKWIEKAVDVMIATDMLSMAYEKKYDVAYLLSADGDFAPAIKKVRELTGLKVFVASPTEGHEIGTAANTFIRLHRSSFHDCWKK